MRWLVASLLLAGAGALGAQSTPAAYPPLRDYLMAPDAEIALAASAAPAAISGRATLQVLTESGYRTVRPGDNGFVCLVLRGWGAPTFNPAPLRQLVYDATLRAPICFDPVAARTVLPYQELRARLGMAGKGPDAIAAGVESAYARGELPEMERVAFAYMWSAGQRLGPAGAYHPHMMVYTPYYRNELLGNNTMESGWPIVTDDAGTPFAVTVIPLADHLAITPR
jgi:hypothetical protein